MPRGYGGTAVLWKKDIDHLVTIIPDGGNRIQCIEVNGPEPLLIISVYLPCKGIRDNYEDFNDCLDQLGEIIMKYRDSHLILIGGDFNEDLVDQKQSRRTKTLDDFMSENSLTTMYTEKTFIGSDGVDISTIDYILFKTTMAESVLSIARIENIHTNVSDHYPVRCRLKYSVEHAAPKKIETMSSSKVKWDKLDQDYYVALVNDGLEKVNASQASLSALDNEIVKLNDILSNSAKRATPSTVKRPRKAKLNVWSADIRMAISEKKAAFSMWKKSGMQTDKADITVINKKETTKKLRQVCRLEHAKDKQHERQEILDAKSYDMSLFHKLINRQRGKLKGCINELNVKDQTLKTPDEIIEGWHTHFSELASITQANSKDPEYTRLVNNEMLELVDINAILKNEYTTTNSQQVLKAIKSLNKGKALDAHGVSAEHFIHGGEKLKQTVTLIINKIFQLGAVTESMKIGILTPVFKKKGSASDAKNYRGITVTPTITKILETVIRENIQPMISESQHPLQRGFTLNSSPMNCSLLLDEVIREYKDRNEPVYVAFLDAKSAFDVVWHASLMRKLYHIGIEGSPWTVIKSLHEEAKTVVKWDGLLSESYVCQQGVRQGGILSTDLYKIYINDLLSRITDAGTGVKIGEINCGAPTCADDVAIISDKPETLQSLLNIAVDYSEMEKYALQPIKSVVLPINSSKRSNKATQNYPWTMNEENMPIVGSTMHMGIMRSAATEDTAVEENVRKARRTIYSLMASGLHGENGLDPETSVQLMQTYILPVLIYGLEVILPKPTLVERLETVNRKFLKQILSLPTTAGNPAVYILSGTIPIEGTIHKRALSLYGNICRLPESSIEKQVANRQLHVKSFESNSWFIAVKKLFLKYELPDPVNLMEDPPSKLQWKAAVGRAVDLHWQSRIRQSSTMYSSLKHLNEDVYKPGTRHPLIQNIVSERETLRVGTKLKMVTGTYILQVNRASFNQNAPDPTCMLCKSADETLEHFLLCCTALSDTRRPLLAAVLDACVGLEIDTNRQSVLIQIIMDSSAIVTNKDSAKEIEFQSRRLCHALHSERYKRLALVPRKKKQRGTRRHTPY